MKRDDPPRPTVPPRAPERLHADARDILTAALAAVDPQHAVERNLGVAGGRITVAGQAYEDIQAVRVVAVGKAAAAMAQAAERILGPLVTSGICVTKDGHGLPLRTVKVVEAAHPVPDARSLQAGEQVLDAVARLRRGNLLLVLLSGGASSLMEVLAEGVTLEDLRDLTEMLLLSGAPIEEINCVRRAISRIKGGGMLLALPEGVQAAVLVISDVLGSPLAMIGSGPMAPEPAPATDALDVLRTRGLIERIPPRVRDMLLEAAAGDERRTRRLRDRAERVRHVIVADNRRMAEAAERMAHQRGYQTLLLTTFAEGEAADLGAIMAAVAREIHAAGRPVRAPACVIVSGEATVKVRGGGRGGRNLEAALAFAVGAAGLSRTALLCAASDGTDGPTDAAGAIADGQTTTRARAFGLDARAMLADNDSYRFFEQLGELLITGPTRTNTNDLLVLMVGLPTS